MTTQIVFEAIQNKLQHLKNMGAIKDYFDDWKHIYVIIGDSMVKVFSSNENETSEQSIQRIESYIEGMKTFYRAKKQNSWFKRFIRAITKNKRNSVEWIDYKATIKYRQLMNH